MGTLTLFELEPLTLSDFYSRAIRTPEGAAEQDFYERYNRLIAEAAQKYGVPVENAVIAFARLSPRTNVITNKNAFLSLIAGREKPAGITSKIWTTAQKALEMTDAEIDHYLYHEPLTKVRAFARNLLLDDTCVCLDSIMLRILRYTHGIISRSELFSNYAEIHKKLYTHIKALDTQKPPYAVQAVLWGYARARLLPVEED